MRHHPQGSSSALPLPTITAAGAAGHAAPGRRPGDATGQTSIEGCIDALRSSYPTVARLAGEARFRAAAAACIRANGPAAPARLAQGDAFERFLAGFAPAGDLPWLPGVARLDRFCVEARAASDEAPVDPRALAGLATQRLMRVVLRPRASARWCWFDAQPIFTLWSRGRTGGVPARAAAGSSEGALVLRAQGGVRWLPLDAAGHAFIVACAGGGTLADAAAAALAADCDADGAAVLAPLLDAGAFAAVPRPPGEAGP